MSLSRMNFLKFSVLTGGALAGGYKFTEQIYGICGGHISNFV